MKFKKRLITIYLLKDDFNITIKYSKSKTKSVYKKINNIIAKKVC